MLTSLLTPEEKNEPGLATEAAAFEQAGIQYMNFPIADREVPASRRVFAAALYQVKHAADSGKSLGAHCRAGVGRSSLMIAALLCRQGMSSQGASSASPQLVG